MVVRNPLNRTAFRRLNQRPWLVCLVMIACVTLPGYFRIQQAIDDARDAQVQSCENGNDQRAASLTLWEFIFVLSAQPEPGETPPTQAEQEQLEDIRVWIGDLYAQRDCSDLTKEYPIPPPPEILQLPGRDTEGDGEGT